MFQYWLGKSPPQKYKKYKTLCLSCSLQWLDVGQLFALVICRFHATGLSTKNELCWTPHDPGVGKSKAESGSLWTAKMGTFHCHEFVWGLVVRLREWCPRFTKKSWLGRLFWFAQNSFCSEVHVYIIEYMDMIYEQWQKTLDYLVYIGDYTTNLYGGYKKPS